MEKLQHKKIIIISVGIESKIWRGFYCYLMHRLSNLDLIRFSSRFQCIEIEFETVIFIEKPWLHGLQVN